MRIRDWSSDVCSSDLLGRLGEPRYGKRGEQGGGEKECAQQARFGAGGGHDRKTRSRRPRRQPGQRHGELCPICAIGCPGPARRTGRKEARWSLRQTGRTEREDDARPTELPVPESRALPRPLIDRKSVVEGKSVPVRVTLGGRRRIKKKKK